MSSAIWLLWRARLRGSFRRIVVLVVLTAIGGGLSLAVAAGARRTASAHDTVVRLTNGADLGSSYGPHDPSDMREQISAIPAVGEFTQLVGFLTLLPETPVAGLTSFGWYSDPVVVERPVLLDGRLPDAANEVFLNESGAAAAGVSVGDELNVAISNFDFTEFLPETMVVVGIGVLPDEVYLDETGAKPTVVYGAKFIDAHRPQIAWGAAAMLVAPDADRDDAVAQLLERDFIVDNVRGTDRDQARGAIRPLAVTLWTLALLAALATVVVVGQALHRLVQRSPAAARSLAAMGCGRSTLLAADVGVAVTVGVLGTVGAIGAAVLVSPLFPQGRARRIDDLRGVDVDVTILGLGALALLFALTGVVAATSLRRGASRLRPGSAPGILGIDPTVATGVRFATGRRGLPGTVAGVAVGLTAIIAAVVFTGSMQRLVSKPALSGFSWDLVGRNVYADIDTAAIAETLRDDPAVERITGLTFADVTVDGTPVPASVWAAVEGSPWPPLIAGRAPSGPNEILVSSGTLEHLGHEIGDTVTVGFSADTEQEPGVVNIDMTIVGTAVSPSIGLAGSDTPRLGTGVLVRAEDVADLNVVYGSAVLFDLAEGVDPAAVEGRFPDGLPDDAQGLTDWFETAQPAEVIQSDDAIDVLMLAIAALLIGMMATIAHNLLSFVRQRRNAFAVLKALGFTPRQIRSTVLWQSGLVVGAALVLAIPIGIAAGRWLYQGFAGGIGVIVEPAVPLLALTAAIVSAVVLVQTVALVPARQARHTDAATELRWE